ncbi:Heterokaryon incompatibility protein 6- OR allele [Apiospora phragmitis]|uniref:Heterokaryon incompatibility protein 6- OR allele n=1 Tax=Apiospora phragmitis TaxID=2905665 RepID=A0ABR1X753_9PEZI
MIQDAKVSAERIDLRTVHQHCPDRPYLELTVPDNAIAVTFIKYHVYSRDQGRAGQDGVNRSSTWFDAAVRRPPNRSSLPNFTLFINKRDFPEFLPHHARWARWGEKSTLAKLNWLAALLPGDVIQIIPRAKLQGWVNIVREAHMTIGYQFEDRAPSLSAPQELVQSNKRLHGKSLQSTRDEIRVLLLQPAENHDDPVFCSLHHLRLGQQEEFEPLSYCWGDSDKTEDVTIDVEPVGGSSLSIPVAQSIVEALRQLRLPDKARRLWIDQLCINQSDRGEKTQQVGLMARVYSEASMVHIWLGAADRATAAALAVVRDIYNNDRETVCIGGEGCRCTGTRHIVGLQHLKKRFKNRRGPGASYQGDLGAIFQRHLRTWSGEVRQSASPLKGSPTLSQLLSCLFSNPWFRRVWVIQEALCPSRAVVRCGPELVPWDEVIHANNILSSIEFAANHPYNLAPAVTMPSVWNVLLESRQTPECIACADGRMCILCVFLHGLSLQATVAQDKLFALLPVGRETAADQQEEERDKRQVIPQPLRPDYATPIGTVMADFTRWWIAEYLSLDILSWTHCQPGRTWRRTSHDACQPELSSPTWALGVDGKHTWGEAALLNEHRYTASDDSIPDLELITQPLAGVNSGGGGGEHRDRLQLKLRGYQICEIQEITYLALDNHIPAPAFKNIKNNNSSRPKSNTKPRNRSWPQPQPPQDDQDLMTKPAASLLRAFDRTFDPAGIFKFWNAWWPQSDRPHDHRPRERILHRLLEPSMGPFVDHVAAHTRYYQQQRQPSSSSSSSSSEGEEAYSFAALSGDASAPLVRCSADVGCPACLDPFFFVGTDNGKTKGLCPWPARVGDVVVLLSGGKVPYLLRPIPDDEEEEAKEEEPGEAVKEAQGGRKYQFVGECFVMGAMQGSYYEKQTREGRELSVFTLV